MYETIGAADMKATEFGKAQREAQVGRGLDDGQIRGRSEATLSSIMQGSDELIGLLSDLGGRLDRVEIALAGPVPSEASAAKAPSSASCLTDALDERLSRARRMASRLHETLSRIERRIG